MTINTIIDHLEHISIELEEVENVQTLLLDFFEQQPTNNTIKAYDTIRRFKEHNTLAYIVSDKIKAINEKINNLINDHFNHLKGA